jgi:ABC-type phosphate transport system substrate-binding protein
MKTKIRALVALALVVVGSRAWALKYAAPGPRIPVDPSIPSWHPGDLKIEPEEEFNVVGADIMDEITLGWIKQFRQAYPPLSVTMEARASGSGGPALTEGTAHAAPVGRELLPVELEAFVKRFGYPPLEIKVATGSVGSLGKTASSIVLVHKDNPITGLTLAQLDAIYSKDRKRGHADIRTWGDLGLKGVWATRPIKLYGLRPPNGIEQYVKRIALLGGEWKDGIQQVKGEGFTHAFTVAAKDIGATNPGGLTYGLLANVIPDVKVVPLAAEPGGPFVLPTQEDIYTHRYPFSRFVYIYVNRKPGQPLEPKVKEFLKLVLSREGQQVVSEEAVFLPLTAEVVREELAKLD